MLEYISDPQQIEKESFRKIRQLVSLEARSRLEAQVVMRVVHSLGLPQLADQMRFSPQACERGMAALLRDKPIICDVEMVKQGVTKRMINEAPLCFLNETSVIDQASATGMTRSMVAVEHWKPYLADSVVVIGNAPTALFRLLELLSAGAPKPALIIGMPVGFVGAEESKDALWQHHISLNVACITLLGRVGGSAAASATCNALLRCNKGVFY